MHTQTSVSCSRHTWLLSKPGYLAYRHVEMLRDDMSLQKKEMQTARADISNAVAAASSIDGRVQLLEGEMRSLSKKLTGNQAARDKAAAANKLPAVMPVCNSDCHKRTYSDWYHAQCDCSIIGSAGCEDRC